MSGDSTKDFSAIAGVLTPLMEQHIKLVGFTTSRNMTLPS